MSHGVARRMLPTNRSH